MLSNKNPAKNMNDEWRNKISISLKNNKFVRHDRSKSINQLDLNNKFINKWKSATDASKNLNICKSSILLCVKGCRNKAGKFKWERAL
jgi:hypothetical protein